MKSERPCAQPDCPRFADYGHDICGTHRHRLDRGLPALAAACTHGHEFTPENTYRRPTGERQCRACNRAAVARYRERRAA